MKVLITGSRGQLGTQLRRKCPAGIELAAFDHEGLDIADRAAVQRAAELERPDVIINTAAFTAVDAAESEPEAAARVNEAGARHVAIAAAALGARLIHISTDYVFDGTASTPYTPDADPNPLNVYGRTKLDGERAVLQEGGERAVIVRTSWVYSEAGRNFFTAMLGRMKAGQDLRIVADQVGTPTWAGSLAEAVWLFATKPAVPGGIHHWTDAGVATWYDFAVAIMEECLAAGMLPRPVAITPISTDQYPTPAPRPAYSVLDKSGSWTLLDAVAGHWRESLRRMLTETAAHAV